MWLQSMLRAEEEQPAMSALTATQDAAHKFAELLRRRVQAGEALRTKWIAELDRRRMTGRPVWHSDAPRRLQRPSVSDRGIIPAAPASGFPFEVSSLTVERALSIANVLAIGAQARGIKSTLSPAGTWTLEIGAVVFTLRLREVQTLKAVELEGPLAALGPVTRYRPTDRLALLVYRPRGEAIRLSDGARRLEEQLDSLFPKLYRAVVAQRQFERAARQEAVERAALEAKMQEQARQREDEAKARLLAAEREAKLVQDAMRWQQAELLRAYATAAEGHIPEYELWREWVLQVAARLDPLTDVNRALSVALPTEGNGKLTDRAPEN
uniref:hypothetical protein n=2 Tax=uncultured Pseudacidovorax sp. TaxID=679313 RepID=UPI0025F04800|nr:hypothetical protein [uncultured Pseudacidovorax sp.]